MLFDAKEALGEGVMEDFAEEVKLRFYLQRGVGA